MRGLGLTLALVVSAASTAHGFTQPRWTSRVSRARSVVVNALDYNDPEVAAELQTLMATDMGDIEDELGESGITPPATMNEMDIRLMLIEVRMRNAGKFSGDTAGAAPVKKAPGADASEFEKAMYQYPKFEALYRDLTAKGDTNSVNVITELLNDPAGAKTRYAKEYSTLIEQIEKCMVKEVTKKLSFTGFPANMGEAGVKMTLEALGGVTTLTCEESDDMLSMGGTVEFEELESAQKAIDQYDGMDMGLGTKLTMRSL